MKTKTKKQVVKKPVEIRLIEDIQRLADDYKELYEKYPALKLLESIKFVPYPVPVPSPYPIYIPYQPIWIQTYPSPNPIYPYIGDPIPSPNWSVSPMGIGVSDNISITMGNSMIGYSSSN